MGKSKFSADAPNSQKYGVPFYGAAWFPSKHITSPAKSSDGEGKEDDHQSVALGDCVVLAGGGGEGRSGIPNAIVLARFDFVSNSLSPEPVSQIPHLYARNVPFMKPVFDGNCIAIRLLARLE